MKQGDKIDVTIHGVKVADAEIQEVGDGQVTLVVPGTIVVMATSTSIAPEATVPAGTPEVERSSVEHQITGVDRVSSNGEVAPVAETAGDTPVVPAPPITDPGQTQAGAPTNNVAPQPVTQDAAQQSVEQVVSSESIAPTVGDNSGSTENPQGNTNPAN